MAPGDLAAWRTLAAGLALSVFLVWCPRFREPAVVPGAARVLAGWQLARGDPPPGPWRARGFYDSRSAYSEGDCVFARVHGAPEWLRAVSVGGGYWVLADFPACSEP